MLPDPGCPAEGERPTTIVAGHLEVVGQNHRGIDGVRAVGHRDRGAVAGIVEGQRVRARAAQGVAHRGAGRIAELEQADGLRLVQRDRHRGRGRGIDRGYGADGIGHAARPVSRQAPASADGGRPNGDRARSQGERGDTVARHRVTEVGRVGDDDILDELWGGTGGGQVVNRGLRERLAVRGLGKRELQGEVAGALVDRHQGHAGGVRRVVAGVQRGIGRVGIADGDGDVSEGAALAVVIAKHGHPAGNVRHVAGLSGQ